MSEAVLSDRRVGLISLSMWMGTAVRVYSLLSFSENAQSASAMIIMFVLLIAWPTWGYSSYLKWRVPVLSFVRIYLIALPFNFSTAVFDAIAPNAGSGRFALVSNIFQLFLAIRIALLTFTSLGFRVPFRLHLLLQTVNIAIFIRYGLHPYCHSKLLTSMELQSAAKGIHTIMACGSMLFMLNVSVQVPADDYSERAAFVLFCWMILGWLLPTLLLLPSKSDQAAAAAAAAEQQQQQRDTSSCGSICNKAADKLLAGFEAWLRLLQMPSARRRQQPRDSDQALLGRLRSDSDSLVDSGYLLAWLLHWWVVLMVTWRVACYAAGPLQPLFVMA